MTTDSSVYTYSRLAANIYLETPGDAVQLAIPKDKLLRTWWEPVLTTVRDNQTEIEVHLLYGHSPRASQNTSIGRWVISGIPPLTAGIKIGVWVVVDESGRIGLGADLGGTSLPIGMRGRTPYYTVTGKFYYPEVFAPCPVPVTQTRAIPTEVYHDRLGGTYSVIEANGKYGLVYDRDYKSGELLLWPSFNSVRVTNLDVRLEELLTTEESKQRASEDRINEHNYEIVIADGKQGLVEEQDWKTELRYDQIIKLAAWYYLCREGTTCTLFEHPDDKDRLEPLATIEIKGELTLSKLLQTLSPSHPQAFAMLTNVLQRDPQTNAYISPYRFYWGDIPYHAITFTVATQRVIMSDNFQITPFELDCIYK